MACTLTLQHLSKKRNRGGITPHRGHLISFFFSALNLRISLVEVPELRTISQETGVPLSTRWKLITTVRVAPSTLETVWIPKASFGTVISSSSRSISLTRFLKPSKARSNVAALLVLGFEPRV